MKEEEMRREEIGCFQNENDFVFLLHLRVRKDESLVSLLLSHLLMIPSLVIFWRERERKKEEGRERKREKKERKRKGEKERGRESTLVSFRM